MIWGRTATSATGAVVRGLLCCLFGVLLALACPDAAQAENANEAVFAQAPCAYVEVGPGGQTSSVVAKDHVIEVPKAYGAPVVRDLSDQPGVLDSYEVQFQYGLLAWNAFVISPGEDDAADENSVRVELPSAAGVVVLSVSHSEFGGDRERSLFGVEALGLFASLFRGSSGDDGALAFSQVPEGTKIATPYYSLVVPKEDGQFDCVYSEGRERTEDLVVPMHVLEVRFKDAGPTDLIVACHDDGTLDGIYAIVPSGVTARDGLGVYVAVTLDDSFRDDFDAAFEAAHSRAVGYASSVTATPSLAENAE